MNFSIPKSELCDYVTKQLNTFYPDKFIVKNEISQVIDITLDRLDFCFSHALNTRYNGINGTIFNHLYADHYVMFLWYLSSAVYKELNNSNISSKLYYLNKSLHGVDCMFDTKMPNIFLIFHGVGTMIGKAEYNDFFVILQGCTVGSHNGKYPVFGKGVALAANSSVIGDCKLGDRATVATRTTLFKKEIQNDHTAFVNFETGGLEIKHSKNCYAQQFFNIDLNNIDLNKI
ncbi:MAG: serine acetyltransferase [Mucilaginibacter sp.]|nr:serine acetyltransferase [Mucilaginibacter sp.]